MARLEATTNVATEIKNQLTPKKPLDPDSVTARIHLHIFAITGLIDALGKRKQYNVTQEMLIFSKDIHFFIETTFIEISF